METQFLEAATGTVKGCLGRNVFVWTDADITTRQVSQLRQTSVSNVKSTLADMYKLHEHATKLQADTVLDLFLNTIRYAMDHGFSDVQTAAFFTVVKRLHEMCTSTPFDNIEECFQYFRELMLCHSVQRPPWSIALFTAQQVQSMAEHVVHTYFKHFLLYKYAFTPKLTMDISLKYSDSMEKDSVEETSAKDSDSGENEQGVIDAPLAV